MSAINTKFPVKQPLARKVHQATTIVGKNGLPIDALATVEPGTTLIGNNASGVSYASPTVTVAGGVDLSVAENFQRSSAKHTGVLLFSDSAGDDYFIDPNSIDNGLKTFNIYNDSDFSNPPSSIAEGEGWIISEAELVNRLQTTSSAVIDQVDFRDIVVKLNLDATEDSVAIVDSDGNELDINPDGSINVNSNVDAADGDNLAISAHPDQIFDEAAGTLTTTNFTEIFTYTASSDDTKVIALDVTVSTQSLVQVKLNGTVIRQRRISASDQNINFYFREHRSLSSGDIISVEAKANRLFKTQADTFTSLEGYIA